MNLPPGGAAVRWPWESERIDDITQR